VCASGITRHIDGVAHVQVDRFEQGLEPHRVSSANAPQMTFIDSRGDELGQGLLFKNGRVLIVEPLCPGEGRSQ